MSSTEHNDREQTQHSIQMPPGVVAAGIFLLVLTLVMGAANLYASYKFNQNSNVNNTALVQKQDHLRSDLESKICSVFGRISDLVPPSGDVASAGRIYEQRLQAYLSGVPDVLGCSKR
jgi:hypothetical protein